MNSVKPFRRKSLFSKLRETLKKPEKKEPETLGTVLKSLAESSSLHGIPKMVSSPQIAVKVLWCLLFLATFGFLTYQVYNLFTTYYSNPVDTTVSLQFSPHRFPAITLCNMNPVKESKMPEELKKLSSTKKKKSSRKKRSANKNQEFYDVYDVKIDSVETKENGDYVKIDSVETKENVDYFSVDSKIKDTHGVSKQMHGTKESKTVTSISESFISGGSDYDVGDGSFLGQHIAPTRVDRSEISQNTKQLQPSEAPNPNAYIKQLEALEDKLLHRVPRSAASSSSSGSSSSSSDLSSSDSSSSDSVSSSLSSSSDYYYYYYTDYYGYYGSGSSESQNDDHSDDTGASSSYTGDTLVQNFQDILTGERDNWEWFRRRFQYAFKSMPVENRTEIGHDIDEMVLKLSFLGYNRNISRFKRMATPEYGNCYTLDDELFKAWRSGPSNGLTLTMNLQKDEYIQGFGSGYGVRIVFHEAGTFPLPSAEGITLSPGTETNIALKTVKISRLGSPYGECTGGGNFDEKYNYKYSSSTCLQICRTQVVRQLCDCVPFDDPEIGASARNGDTPICDMTNTTTELCVLESDGALGHGDVTCECPPPCNQYVYEKTLSWRQWPNSDYLENVLIKQLCLRNLSSTEDITYTTEVKTSNCSSGGNDTATNTTDTPTICSSNINIDVFEWQKNFLRVQIYFEDLNYEFISEKPSYEFIRFISDIGGTMGLFIGASLLSLMEFLQLSLEICLWSIQRWKNRQQSNTTVQVLPTVKQSEKN